MTRILPLALPLLSLWFFWCSDQRGISETQLQVEKSTFSARSKKTDPTPPTLANGNYFNESLRPSLPFSISARPLIDHFSPLPSLETFPCPSLSGRAQKIWQSLPPETFSELSKPQLKSLADLIETRLIESDEGALPWICRDQTTPRAMATAFHQIEQAIAQNSVGILATQFMGSGKWTRVASETPKANKQGNPVTVTWSIVPDGTSAPGLGTTPSAPSDFRAWLSGIYGDNPSGIPSEQSWFQLVSRVFEAMEENSGLSFVYEENDDGAPIIEKNQGQLGLRGDIRISARTIDGSGNPDDQSNTLGFAYAPNFGDIILDSADPFYDDTILNSIGLFNALTHELGHALGLSHVCPLNETKLMEPLISRAFRGPQYDEFYSLQRQYGDELEGVSDGNDNDASTRATALTLDTEGFLERTWLSIDDNNDIDYYSFSAKRLDQIQAAVNPGSENYAEGPATQNCNTSATFNASSQQNLIIDLLDMNGRTILASAAAAEIGEIEILSGYQFEADGTYFLRVNGGNTNSSQIYTLFLNVSGAPLFPEINLIRQDIVAESGIIKNSRLDSGETIKVQLEFSNTGEVATTNLTANLSGPDGVTFFPSQIDLEDIPLNEARNAEIIFAVEGACGFEIPITVELLDEKGYRKTFTLDYFVGESLESTLLAEGFKASNNLPTGWSTGTTGGAIAWRSSSDESQSGTHSIFAEGTPSRSTSTLTSSPFTLGNFGSTLSFFHRHDSEERWDGGVLEASLDSGPWFDLPEHNAVSVVSGDYSATMRRSANSDIAGRRAWTGDSGGFIESIFELPAAWSGQSIRFRWILAHDASSSNGGWFVDDVTLTTIQITCEPHRPELEILLSETKLSEMSPTLGLSLRLTSALPLLNEVTINLSLSGTGEAADLVGLAPLTLPPGEIGILAILKPVDDSLPEGEESITLTIPNDVAEFAPGTQSTATLIISDQETYQRWANHFFPTTRPPNEDSDGDGWSNLAEYLLATDPANPAIAPSLDISVTDESTTLSHNPAPDRSDAALGLEQSPDLQNWSPVGFRRTIHGLKLPRESVENFLRLTFSLNP